MQKHMTRAGKTKIECVMGDGPSFMYWRRERAAGIQGLEARGDRAKFTKEREDGPPLPWVIMWRGTWRETFGAELPEALKMRGYVFWDCKRLVKSGGKDKLVSIWREARPD